MSSDSTAAFLACAKCGAALSARHPGSVCWRCMIDSDAVLGTVAELPMEQPVQGALRFGDYLIEAEIAHGGMGVVYQARQLSLGRVVALKLLLLGKYSSARTIERFKREAQAAAALRHPFIVAIYEVGECDGQYYLAMEHVDGRSLAEMLRDGILPARRAAEIIRDIAQATFYAHSQGVLHRDLKPSNVLIDALGQVRITDFGLAKKLNDDSDLTMTGQIVGTPNYLSPEQAAGRNEEVGPASDVHAIGALLYELLTGRPPFLAPSMQETLLRIRDSEPVHPRSINPAIHRDLETICLKCLEKEPSRRYATAQALADDLERWLEQRPIDARRAGVMKRVYLWCRRKPRQAAMAGLLVFTVTSAVALLAGLAIVSTRARHDAEIHELAARRRAYAADINLVQQALELNNLGRAEELLNQHRPVRGELDLRDWEWRYLWQQCRNESLFSLAPRPSSIWSLHASADGRWLAVGEEKQGALRVWDWQMRQPVAEFQSGGGEVLAAFSPAAPVLAASFESGRRSTPFTAGVRLWNITNRQQLAELPLEGRCRGLYFSRDGQRLLTSTADPGNRIAVWNVSDARKLIEVPAPQFDGVGTPFATTPDLSLAAFRTSRGAEFALVDLTTGAERWRTNGAEDTVTALAFSPDGNILASGPGYTESTIRIWDVATGRLLGRLEGHSSWVSALVFLPGGKTLASASADQTIRLWELSTFKSLGTFRGHRREVWRLMLMPDGVTLVSGSKDGIVSAWDIRTLRADRRRITFPMGVAAWHFRGDADSVITVDTKGRVAEWSGPNLSAQQTIMEINADVAEACFSKDGDKLAVQAPTGSVQVWHLKQREMLGTLAVSNSYAFVGAFRDQGRKLLMPNWGGEDFYEWNLATFQQSQSWRVAGDRPAWALSSDERYCISIGQEANTMVRDLETGQMIAGRLNIEDPGGIALCPRTATIAAVSKQSYVRLWDFTSRKEIATFRGFLMGLHGIAFSANGRRLAIGSNGREAMKLWDLESRQELLTLSGQGSIFSRVRFSPSGNMISARNSQKIVHLWRAPSWEDIAAAEKGALPPQDTSSGLERPAVGAKRP